MSLPILPQSHPANPARGNHTSTLSIWICLFWIFIWMEPCRVWLSWTGFFDSAQCFQGSSMLDHVSVLRSFSWLHSIPGREYIHFFNPSIRRWPVGLLWIMLLWAFTYRCLWGCMISFLLGRYSGMELLGYVVNCMVNISWKIQTDFQKGQIVLMRPELFKLNTASEVLQQV